MASRLFDGAAKVLKTTESSEAHSPDDLAIVAQWGRPGREYLGMLGQFP